MSHVLSQGHRRWMVVPKAMAGALAAALVLVASGSSDARTAASKAEAHRSVEKASISTGAEHAHHPCAHGYPMHHWHPCGTMTGGPSGGLH